jgi:hypothetical protein
VTLPVWPDNVPARLPTDIRVVHTGPLRSVAIVVRFTATEGRFEPCGGASARRARVRCQALPAVGVSNAGTGFGLLTTTQAADADIAEGVIVVAAREVVAVPVAFHTLVSITAGRHPGLLNTAPYQV